MRQNPFFGFAAAMLLVCACHGEKPPETTSGADASSSTSSTAASSGPTGGATDATNSTNSNGSATTDNRDNPTQPGTCGGRTCGPGETCASYYGIAGGRGPLFHDCVIRCRRGEPNDGCPAGKTCHTIADGPGDVCN